MATKHGFWRVVPRGYPAAALSHGVPAAAPVTRLVANRGEMPYQLNSAIAAGSVKRVCRTRHTFGGQNVTEMRIVWCGFYANASSGDTNTGSDNTLNASVEIIGAPTPLVRVKFSDVNQGTITNGAAYYISDTLYPSDFGLSVFAANSIFWVKDERECPTSGSIVNHGQISTPTLSGEGMATAATGTATQVDTAGALVFTGGWTTSTTRFMPVAFIGKTVAPEISLLILGDSIDNRQADGAGDGANGGGGFWVRGTYSIGGRAIPYVNFGNPSERASLFKTAQGDKRRSLLAQLGLTHAVTGLGTNDLGNGRTAAQTIADLRLIWADLRANRGITHIEHRLITPRATVSVDSWATIIGQTPSVGFETGGTLRDPLNAAIIANVGSDGLDAYLDLNTGAAADGTALDKWAVTGAANYATADGIHPSAAMHGIMDDIVAVRAATWTAAPF